MEARRNVGPYQPQAIKEGPPRLVTGAAPSDPGQWPAERRTGESIGVERSTLDPEQGISDATRPHFPGR